MEPLKNATQEANRQSTGFILANNQPCRISDKARMKARKAAMELFSFGNDDDDVNELLSAKRKAYTDPKKTAKKKKLQAPKIQVELMSDWDDEDEEIEWSDCDADLSRTIEDLDKSLRDGSAGENSFRSN